MTIACNMMRARIEYDKGVSAKADAPYLYLYVSLLRYYWADARISQHKPTSYDADRSSTQIHIVRKA